MGQKVNPHGLRVGVIKGWDSKWYAGKDYEKFLLEDIKIREFIKEKLFLSGISKVEIERASNKARISIHTAKPGMVIGRQGSNIELLKSDLKKMTESAIEINICTPCVLTSIMALQKHIPLMAVSALRYGFTKVKFFLKAKKQLKLLRQRRHNQTCYYRRELNIVNNIEVV